MSERPVRTRRGQTTPPLDETFIPTATMMMMLGYIVLFAVVWGLVYYLELLARR